MTHSFSCFPLCVEIERLTEEAIVDRVSKYMGTRGLILNKKEL
ncbi:hypothetical protein [Desulfoplanes sp.]